MVSEHVGFALQQPVAIRRRPSRAGSACGPLRCGPGRPTRTGSRRPRSRNPSRRGGPRASPGRPGCRCRRRAARRARRARRRRWRRAARRAQHPAHLAEHGVLQLDGRHVVQHRERDGAGEAAVLERHRRRVALDDVDVRPASRVRRSAARAGSSSMLVSAGTSGRSRSVVMPGPGPISSTSAPRASGPSGPRRTGRRGPGASAATRRCRGGRGAAGSPATVRPRARWQRRRSVTTDVVRATRPRPGRAASRCRRSRCPTATASAATPPHHQLAWARGASSRCASPAGVGAAPFARPVDPRRRAPRGPHRRFDHDAGHLLRSRRRARHVAAADRRRDVGPARRAARAPRRSSTDGTAATSRPSCSTSCPRSPWPCSTSHCRSTRGRRDRRRPRAGPGGQPLARRVGAGRRRQQPDPGSRHRAARPAWASSAGGPSCASPRRSARLAGGAPVTRVAHEVGYALGDGASEHPAGPGDEQLHREDPPFVSSPAAVER